MQRAMSAEHARLEKLWGRWELDDASAACRRCSRQFSLVWRRHHCRHCGQLVCSSCSERTFKLTANDGTERAVPVCSSCYGSLVKVPVGQWAVCHSADRPSRRW